MRRFPLVPLTKLLAAVLAVGLGHRAISAAAEEPPKSEAGATPPTSAAATVPMVQLNFPDEVELRLFVDYVSARMGVKILFDDQVANKRITIKSPGQIPADSLMGLLESTLKMKGFALVNADVPGWKRIVPTNDLSQISQARGDRPLEDFGVTTAITQVFALKHVDPERIGQIIKPFLTQPGGNTINVNDQRLIIVTDYADNLRKISKLIETIDRAGPPTALEFYAAQHMEAVALSQQIAQSLARQAATPGLPKPEVSHDERTNKVLIVGTKEQIAQILQLARALDVPLGLRTEIYSFRFVDAARINQLVQELFDPLTIKRLYRSAVDTTDNLLVVTATDEIHHRINWLREQLDQETKRPGSAVKFYRLRHASAVEVLATIQAIEQTQQESRLDHLRGVSLLGRSSANTSAQGITGPIPDNLAPSANRLASLNGAPGELPAAQTANAQLPVDTATEKGASGLVAGAARVTVDQPTNTIIVIADRATQLVYEELCEYLDRRPLQVMVEAKVVIIDTSNNFSLGVDLSAVHTKHLGNLLAFTQFGVATVDPVSGATSIVPGRGFNSALVNPETGDAILRALSGHKKAKVVSSPRVLVNDNGTGSLASVQEVPFTSVNASSTVATTSFGGFAEAGTTIEVTPRISDDDHLQLDYVISLNSFTGSGGAGVPPPRQTDEVTSSVTIPDGYTVIVGGLTRQNISDGYEGIPGLDKLPGIRYLVGQTNDSKSQTTMFVFLKPIILRDDKFSDLKFLSDRDLGEAETPGNFPCSQALFVD
jgi:general secretion pathway protein D